MAGVIQRHWQAFQLPHPRPASYSWVSWSISSAQWARAVCDLFPLRVGIVAGNGIVGENPQIVVVPSGAKPLKRADANVRLRDAGENSTGHHAFADHLVTACYGGERTGRRHTESGHSF